MLPRKIKIVFIFSLLLFSTNIFAQTFVGFGGGIGSMCFTGNSKNKVPDYVPKAFLCFEKSLDKNIFLELDFSHSAKQTVEFPYTYWCGSPASGAASCTSREDYDFLHYQMTLLFTWRSFLSEKFELFVGIGGLIKHNDINYTYRGYPLYPSHFFTGSYGGFASDIGFNIKLNSHFALAPRIDYTYNFPPFDIHGYSNFRELYFSIALKFQIGIKRSATPESPPK